MVDSAKMNGPIIWLCMKPHQTLILDCFFHFLQPRKNFLIPIFQGFPTFWFLRATSGPFLWRRTTYLE